MVTLDVNNDGFLDEQELEALFTKEVNEFIKYLVFLFSLFSFCCFPFFHVGLTFFILVGESIWPQKWRGWYGRNGRRKAKNEGTCNEWGMF